jgi:hypothetical protein
MTFPIATLDYTFNQEGGASVAALEAAMAAVLVPLDLLAAIGTRLSSDTTSNPSGAVVKRRVTVALSHVNVATASPVMSGDGTEVTSVSVTAAGSGYNALPVVKIVGDAVKPAVVRPFLKLVDSNIVQGGSGYAAPSIYFQGGLEIPQVDELGLLLRDGVETQGCVQGLTLVSGGRGYSTKAVVQFLCNLAPGGRFPVASLALDSRGAITGLLITDAGAGLLNVPEVVVYDSHSSAGEGAVISPQMGIGTAATGTLSITLGSVTGFTPVSSGGPYVSMPRVVVVDTTGSGALLTPLMGIKEIDVVFGGQGYNGATPTVSIQDFFDSLFDLNDAASAASPFFNLMTTVLSQAVAAPVTAAAPVITL